MGKLDQYRKAYAPLLAAVLTVVLQMAPLPEVWRTWLQIAVAIAALVGTWAIPNEATDQQRREILASVRPPVQRRFPISGERASTPGLAHEGYAEDRASAAKLPERPREWREE